MNAIRDGTTVHRYYWNKIKTAKIECLRCVLNMDAIHENRNTVAYKKVMISNKQSSDTEFQNEGHRKNRQ